MKTCNACGETKPFTEFYRNRLMTDGLLKRCKACVNARQRAYREANRETVRATDRKWYQANRDRKRAYDAEYRAANRDRLLAGKRAWYQANREQHVERSAAWRASNRARVAELDRAGHLRRTAERRAVVFGHYGESCACCGATELLSIDHINGDGREHRELLGRRLTGVSFYRWLISNGLPDGFQTLCSPCNASKATTERCSLNHADRERRTANQRRRRKRVA